MLTFLAFIALTVYCISLSNRITKLESQKGVQPQARPVPPPQSAPAPQVAPALAQTMPAVNPAPVRIAPQPVTQPVKSDDSLEFKFGSQIFTAVGGLAVLAGIAFFLKYAFQTGLITEVGRVALGVLFGIVLIALGYYLNKKYARYGQSLIGIGLGLLYISIYSSSSFYHFISPEAALVLMLIVTAIGVLFALLTDSIVLAAFAGVGGFLTPFLITGASGDPFPLFTYVLALDVGIVLIAFYRLWRPLVFGSFIGTCLVFLSWLLHSYTNSQWLVAEAYLTLFFVLFLIVSLVHYWRQTAPEDGGDLLLITINPLLYFIMSYGILTEVHHEWLGIFTVLLGVLYTSLWVFVRTETSSDRDVRFRSFLAGIGFVFFAIAVPVQFDKFLITIAWAAEALVLTYLGVKIKSHRLRAGSQILFTFVFLRLLLLDSQVAISTPFLNARFISAILSLIAFIAAYWMLYKNSEGSEEDTSLLGFMMAEMSIAFVSAFSWDISQYYKPDALTFFWIVAVGIIASAGFYVKNIVARIISFILLFIVILRVLFINGSMHPDYLPFFNMRFGLMLAVILVSLFFSLMYRLQSESTEKKNARNILLIEMYILAQIIFTLEIRDFFAGFWLPFVWSCIGFIAAYISLVIKNKGLRITVYLTYIVTVIRVIFFDGMVSSTYMPLFNGRVLAFLSIVIALFATAYLLHMHREETDESERHGLISAMSIGANILLISLISLEILDFFNLQLIVGKTGTDRITLENIKRVTLSIAWILYSLVLLGIGITYKSGRARIMAIVLMGIAVLKVFLYDTARLDNFYRFVSYISLGIILLLMGFLYNKYKDRILHFITAENNQ